jgi:hypothetical protein
MYVALVTPPIVIFVEKLFPWSSATPQPAKSPA